MNAGLQGAQAAPPRAGEAFGAPPDADRMNRLPTHGHAGITPPLSSSATRLARVSILATAPAVALLAHTYHPWIGNPSDPDFLNRLAAAIAADPTRWGISHLGIAVASGLLVLAFLAIHGFLRETGEQRWSTLGLPFVVMGSVLYAMVPTFEIGAVGVYRAGADVAAVQAATMSWFMPILLTAAVVFAVGVLGFMVAVARSGLLGSGGTWLVLAALAVAAGSRFFPVGVAQLYVGPAASLVALWTLAYVVGRRPRRLLP